MTGGHFVCIFLKTNIIYDAFMKFSKLPKYSKYMYDVEKCISNFYAIDNPTAILKEMLEDTGFNCIIVNHTKESYDYETETKLKGASKLFWF